MNQRNHLSFDLTHDQWASVNQAMLACFAQRTKSHPRQGAHGDPVNEALAIICRQWLATQTEVDNRRSEVGEVPNSQCRVSTSDLRFPISDLPI